MSSSQAPPWAQVLPPQSGRPDEAMLEQIRQEVRQEVRGAVVDAALRKHQDDMELTRQRMESEKLFHQKEKQEALEMKEQLQAQIAQLQAKLQEAEQRWLREKDEHEKTNRELIRSRHEYDCARITSERMEMEHRTTIDQREASVEQMTQRFEQVNQRSEQMRQRCTDLERRNEELEEQVRQLTSQNSSWEAQASERERDFQNRLGSSTEAARRLEGEKRLLEAELEKVRHQHKEELEKVRQHQKEVEQETRELRCRTAVLEDQLRDSQEQRQRTEQDQQRTEQDLRQWYQKFIESNKENTVLQRANQDHKRDIWELENQLRQERNVANIATPGEYIKLMKAHEGASLATDNNRLKQALTRTQCDLDLCIRKMHEQEKMIKELQGTLASCCKGSAAPA